MSNVIHYCAFMIFEHTDYRIYLNEVLAERKAKNPAYSMRALAKTFGITQAAISQILSRKKGLSLNTAMKIADSLGLKKEEADYFCLLVQMQATKDPKTRELLFRKIQELNPRRKVTDLTSEIFRLISDPHHYTILLLTEIDFEFTPENVAKHLGMNRYEVNVAIDRLQKLDLLEEVPELPGRFRRTKGDIQFSSDVPNHALRSYHKQILTKAMQSLDTQSPKEKVMSSEQVVLAAEDVETVRRLAMEFFSKVIKLSKKPGKKSAVYNVGIQVFKLSHERN